MGHLVPVSNWLIAFLHVLSHIMQALDADIGANSMATYSLGESSGQNSLFSIDSVTGEVITTQDFEDEVAGGQFEFIVMATDPNGVFAASQAYLKVNIHSGF